MIFAQGARLGPDEDPVAGLVDRFVDVKAALRRLGLPRLPSAPRGDVDRFAELPASAVTSFGDGAAPGAFFVAATPADTAGLDTLPEAI